VGFSAGDFGGGSNLANTRFGNFSGRTDFDAMAVWSLENLTWGNRARQRQRQAQANQAVAERSLVIDQIRREVAEAKALCAARLRDIELANRRIESARRAFEQDLRRARNLEGRPIELLNSVNLLTRARQDRIQAVMAYNQAQFQLFVALGKPPTLAAATTP